MFLIHMTLRLKFDEAQCCSDVSLWCVDFEVDELEVCVMKHDQIDCLLML